MPSDRVLEKTLESALDSKEIKAVNPKENQPWISIGRTDAEAPILWPPDAKSWFIGKDPDAGKDWRGKGDDREWYCWMASLTQWTWVWASSKRWWRTGKPGVLQSQTWLRTEQNRSQSPSLSPKFSCYVQQCFASTVSCFVRSLARIDICSLKKGLRFIHIWVNTIMEQRQCKVGAWSRGDREYHKLLGIHRNLRVDFGDLIGTDLNWSLERQGGLQALW